MLCPLREALSPISIPEGLLLEFQNWLPHHLLQEAFLDASLSLSLPYFESQHVAPSVAPP